MNGHTFQDGVILLEFHSLGSVLTVLGRYVTACSGQSTLFHFCALQDYLYTIAFFLACHSLVSYHFNILPVHETFGNSLLQGSIQTYFINHTQTSSTDLQLNPASLLYIVEFLAEQVNVKATLCAVL